MHDFDLDAWRAIDHGERPIDWAAFIGHPDAADYLTYAGKDLMSQAADDLTAFFGPSWLDRAMQAAEPVFVYEDSAKKNILGFYHLRENAGHPKSVYLSLAAIDVAYQKLGFGLLLYQTVLLECRNRGYAAAETHISVNNLDVLNVFARLGCSFRNPVMTLHWYLGAAGTAP